MKNLVLFYLALSLPLALIIIGSKLDILSNGQFFIGLMFFAFFYHPYLSATRLTALGVLKKGEFNTLFFNLSYSYKYAEALYLRS